VTNCHFLVEGSGVAIEIQFIEKCHNKSIVL